MFHVVLNLLGGRRISEEELVRKIWHFLDDLFKRNIFLAGREVADAQAVIEGGLNLSPERQVQMTHTEPQPAPAEDTREQNERQ